MESIYFFILYWFIEYPKNKFQEFICKHEYDKCYTELTGHFLICSKCLKIKSLPETTK